MGHIKGTSSRTDVRAVTRSAALDRRATEVPIMSGWNEQSNGGEGEGMPRPTRTGNSIVYASSVTAVQGDMGPQAWEETDSLPPNTRGPSGELLSAGRGRWRTLPSWLTRSTHRLGGVRAYSLPVASNEAWVLAHEGLQQQPSTGNQQGVVSTPVAATMRPTANSPPVGRERRTTAPAGMNRERGRQTRALGGLQQQEWTGDQQDGVQLFSCNRQLRCTQRYNRR